MSLLFCTLVYWANKAQTYGMNFCYDYYFLAQDDQGHRTSHGAVLPEFVVSSELLVFCESVKMDYCAVLPWVTMHCSITALPDNPSTAGKSSFSFVITTKSITHVFNTFQDRQALQKIIII